ncbi:putative postreplication repair E3 ubiquitin-protein ligase rad-18 [Triangularia setosa]|uniref:Postreplication repair E3 ubiquitin-protein ligase RAD18 n=1 Tax=Triangularia setosa TaxID=2587417 RepID=A0AAN6WFE4_9PEZI|nr:putative postreplication repair E3 ubiquitin-protein ligase rad-18 [Podospora setosa]
MEIEVSDSTDWLGTPLANLKPLEEAFRCHVCKDFFISPMLTSCNHTFCSLCIRRCLNADGKCPLCRKNDDISKLRGNWALREAVEAFVGARDTVLKFARTPASAAVPKSPKRKAAEVDDSDEEFQESKRPRRSTRNRKAKGQETSSQLMIEDSEGDVPESNDGEDEYVPEPNDGLVACPICEQRMKEVLVDRHLDTSCPGEPQPQPKRTPTTNRSIATTLQSPSQRPPAAPAKAPERLPTLQYSMVKDQALRKIMRELGLSIAGNRPMLEARHREWLTLWNANCDSAHPKTRGALLQDLQAWERTIGTMAPTSSKAASTGAQIKDKDFDGGAWAAKHDSSFKDLIANARRSRQMAEQKAKEAAAEESAKQKAGLPAPESLVPTTSAPATAEPAPLAQAPVPPVQPSVPPPNQDHKSVGETLPEDHQTAVAARRVSPHLPTTYSVPPPPLPPYSLPEHWQQQPQPVQAYQQQQSTHYQLNIMDDCRVHFAYGYIAPDSVAV